MPYQKDEGFIFERCITLHINMTKTSNNEIIAELNKVDGEFSMFNKQSTVTAFNNGKKVEASDMFMNALTLSQDVSKDNLWCF